jgi:hypothetical protein
MFKGQISVCRRYNYVHAAYVNAALVLKTQRDLEDVFRLLAGEGVEGAVIARVLFKAGPFRERTYAAPFKAGSSARGD